MVCYDDMLSPEHGSETLTKLLHFWYNGTSHQPLQGPLPSDNEYSGSHSTSHDPTVRQRLAEVARRLDEEYYNGEIAWADSVLPC